MAGQPTRARSAGRSTIPRSGLVRDSDDDTAADVLSAAVHVIGERGYHGTSVRDIAALAAVSPGTIYNHFGSKHDVLVTIMDRGMDNLVTATEEVLYQASPDPVERLCAIVGVHVELHARGPRESYIGNSELRSLEPAALAAIRAKRDAQMRMFHRVVEDGVAKAVFTTPSPRDAARYVITACTAVASWYRPEGRMSIPELVRHHQVLSLATVGFTGDATEAVGR